jgi:ABC-type uncharacterized transport system permease subunit
MAWFALPLVIAPIPKDSWVGCGLIFAVAALLDWLGLKGSPFLKTTAAWVVRAGWVLLTIMLAYQGLQLHALPLGSFAEFLLSVAWGIAGVAIFLDLTFAHRLPSWVIGGSVAACLFIATLLGVHPQSLNTTGKPLILIHVGAAVLAYCILGAQTVNAIAYLLQERALTCRQFTGIYAFLPALVPMDRIGRQLMGAAVWTLGLSLVIGLTDWTQREMALVALPKLIAALMTWVGGLLLLIKRRRERWSGVQFAWGSLILFIPALVALWLSLPNARP